jgi:hypothetical protein
MVGDWRGWPEIGGVEGGIGGKMAGLAVVGGDGPTESTRQSTEHSAKHRALGKEPDSGSEWS